MHLKAWGFLNHSVVLHLKGNSTTAILQYILSGHLGRTVTMAAVWERHLNRKVFVCNFRSGRLKSKQAIKHEGNNGCKSEEILTAKNLHVQLHWQTVSSSALTSCEVGSLAVITAKVSLKNVIKTYPSVLWKLSWTLFVLMLSTPVLANNSLKGLGFKTDSGLYFVHFIEEKSLLVFWRYRLCFYAYKKLIISIFIYIFSLHRKLSENEC